MWKNVSIQNLLLCFPSINCKFNQQKTFFNLSTKLTVQGFLNARGRPIYFLNSSKGFKSPLLFIIHFSLKRVNSRYRDRKMLKNKDQNKNTLKKNLTKESYVFVHLNCFSEK